MVRVTGVVVAVPLVGVAASQAPNSGELTDTVALKGRLALDAVSATVCGGGGALPATELNASAVGVAAKVWEPTTVRFTVTICCPLPGPVPVSTTCAV